MQIPGAERSAPGLFTDEVDGPLRSMSATSRCRSAARHCGLSLRQQKRAVGKFRLTDKSDIDGSCQINTSSSISIEKPSGNSPKVGTMIQNGWSWFRKKTQSLDTCERFILLDLDTCRSLGGRHSGSLAAAPAQPPWPHIPWMSQVDPETL